MYALGEHVKLYAEAGYFQADDDAWGQTEQAKFTLALAVAPSVHYLSRPELRLFVSHLRDWRGEQALSSGDSAILIGTQMEVWW